MIQVYVYMCVCVRVCVCVHACIPISFLLIYSLSLTGKRLSFISSPLLTDLGARSLMSLRERVFRDFRPFGFGSGVRRIGELMRPGTDCASSLPLSGGGVSVLGGACSSEA